MAFHKFSPHLATAYGINAAVIFQNILWSTRARKADWVNLTLDDLCQAHPYLGKKAIRLALRTLVCGTRKYQALLAREYDDRTGYRYRLRGSFRTRDGVDPLLADHRFDTELAEKYGVLAACVHNHVIYWIGQNWLKAIRAADKKHDFSCFDGDLLIAKTKQYAIKFISPAAFTAVSPYATERSVRRALSTLVNNNELARIESKKRTSGFSPSTRDLLKVWRNIMEYNGIGFYVTNTTHIRPKGHTSGQKDTHPANITPCDLRKFSEDNEIREECDSPKL
jgi:hypothetical protein